MNRTRMGTIIANLCLEMMQAGLINSDGKDKIIRAYQDAVREKMKK